MVQLVNTISLFFLVLCPQTAPILAYIIIIEWQSIEMDISCLPTLIEACGEIGLLLPASMDAGGGSILGLALDGL